MLRSLLSAEYLHCDNGMTLSLGRKTKTPRTRRTTENWVCDEQDLLRHKGRLYVPQEKGLRTEIVSTHHDSKLAGHFGAERTYDLIHQSVPLHGEDIIMVNEPVIEDAKRTKRRCLFTRVSLCSSSRKESVRTT